MTPEQIEAAARYLCIFDGVDPDEWAGDIDEWGYLLLPWHRRREEIERGWKVAESIRVATAKPQTTPPPSPPGEK